MVLLGLDQEKASSLAGFFYFYLAEPKTKYLVVNPFKEEILSSGFMNYFNQASGCSRAALASESIDSAVNFEAFDRI